jgi:hypothetical protein
VTLVLSFLGPVFIDAGEPWSPVTVTLKAPGHTTC